MTVIRLPIWILLAACVCLHGCARPKPDPLAGWHFSSVVNLDSNAAITDDYRDYIQKLPPKEGENVGNIKFFEDKTGQHAVQITIHLSGAWWKHVLIYDKNNKRIRQIKYFSGNYRS